MIADADAFAEAAHAGQVRKGTSMPYIEHPRAVARLLADAGVSETVVAAALLHDTVEDTQTTLEDINRRFGAEVGSIVAGVTEDKRKSWERRKRYTITKLKTASEEVLLVTAADKVANARGMRSGGDDVWNRFHRPYPSQRRYYRGVTAMLEERADGGALGTLTAELRAEVDAVFPALEPLDLDELLVAVRQHSTGLGSSLHGEEHWRAVAATGLTLMANEPLADPTVIFCFGLLHDTMRVSDGFDPDHGRRAEHLAGELHADGTLAIAAFQLDALAPALAGHADGETSSDPTVGVCWDADRLHLARIGIEPRRDLLSTPIGDLRAAVAAATETRSEPPGWRHSFERALALG